MKKQYISLGMTQKEILGLKDPELAVLEEIKRKMDLEVYFTIETFSSVREKNRLDENWNISFKDVLGRLSSLGIKSNVLYNNILKSENFDLVNFENILNELLEYNLSYLTIGSWELLNLLIQHSDLPIKDFLKMSVVMNLKEIRDIIFFSRHVSKITLAPARNRDLRFLKELKMRLPIFDLEILVNESCLVNCPFRYEHFLLEGLNRKSVNNFPFLFCNKLLLKSYQTFLNETTFLLPETLFKYPIYKQFGWKLSTRTLPLSRKLEILKKYASFLRNFSEDYNIFELFPHVNSLETELEIKNNLNRNKIFEKETNSGRLKYYYE